METKGSIDASVDMTQVAASAAIEGQSYVTGAKTRIGEGAVIRNSYLENVVVEEGATVVDSILVTQGDIAPPPTRTGYGAKWWLAPDEVRIGERAEVRESLLHNASVGAGSTCRKSAIVNSRIGAANRIKELYGKSVVTGERVRIKGPTEAGGAWFGYGMHIDQCAFFNGTFTNDFYVFRFNREKGKIEVVETVEVPHVSRYGMNLVDSGNSGNIRNQEGGVLKSVGPHVGLWHDRLLKGQGLKHSPMCFVSGWTKVIGKSSRGHASAEEQIEDTLSTYLMPFSVSGYDGDSVIGQVIIGEQNNAYMYKRRIPAWIFSYAPDAVIRTVKRLREGGVDADFADRVVTLSLRNAIELLYLYAYQRNISLESLSGRGGTGWKGWLARARELYAFHLDSGLWEFRDGEPVAWRLQDGKWRPRDEADFLKRVPDAIENQVSEEDVLGCPEKKLKKGLGVRAGELKAALLPRQISPEAQVSQSAWIGPGVQIMGRSVIRDNVRLCRTVVEDSVIGAGSCLLHSVVRKSRVEEGVQGRGLLVRSSSVGAGTTADCARIEDSDLGKGSTVYPFACVDRSVIRHSSIIGTTVRNANVDSLFMSYHMPGYAESVRVEPAQIPYDGKTIAIPVIPMLGGGMRILGKKGGEVTLSGSFIASNTVIEAGAYVGFGCFVMGRLTGDEGLLPFTLSTEAGPEKDQIGGAATNFPHIVISHFIQWTYQSNGPELAGAVARLVPCMLEEGRNAVRAEMERRAKGQGADDAGHSDKYRSLRLYTDAQLQTGLETYDAELRDGRWEMQYVDGELKFTGKGKWTITDGAARWQAEG